MRQDINYPARQRRRNERLAQVLGLTRAGYAPCEIAHRLQVSAQYVRHETRVAVLHADAIARMVAAGTEADVRFPHLSPRRTVEAR